MRSNEQILRYIGKLQFWDNQIFPEESVHVNFQHLCSCNLTQKITKMVIAHHRYCQRLLFSNLLLKITRKKCNFRFCAW